MAATALQLARRHQADRVKLKRNVMRKALLLWRQIDPAGIDQSWRALLPSMLTALTTAQQQAAQQANPYVAGVLAAQGVETAAAGQVVPAAFAGVASDGRDLASLLMIPTYTARAYIGQGMTPRKALAGGAYQLLRMTGTQVADAGRVADQVGTALYDGVGWVRQLDPPSCSRCVILAGKWFRYNQGFERHPLCDCTHIPARESDAFDFTTSPGAYFDSLTAEEQDRVFTKAGAEAIRLGADVGQVVNARRGMRKAQVFGRKALITLEGTTRRGAAFQALQRKGTVRTAEELATRITRNGPELRRVHRVRTRSPRVMPETLLAIAKDREDAIRLLAAHGFILPARLAGRAA